jgi:hypothetical protein
VNEVRAIGDKDDTGGVFVKPADCRGHGIALHPSSGKQFVDERSFGAVMRANIPCRFVEKNQNAVRMVERRSVNQYTV